MKKTILSAVAITGLATSVFGQSIILDDFPNSSLSTSATIGGQLFETIGATTALFDGTDFNIGVTVLAGTSVGSLSSLGTFYPGSTAQGAGNPYTGFSPGQFQLAGGSVFVVPGAAAGQTATIELQIWDYDNLGNSAYTSYAAAVAGGDAVGSAIFTNPTSNAGVAVPPQELSGMPAITLAVQSVPEPVTFAFAGLGIASMLAFRRRK